MVKPAHGLTRLLHPPLAEQPAWESVAPSLTTVPWIRRLLGGVWVRRRIWRVELVLLLCRPGGALLLSFVREQTGSGGVFLLSDSYSRGFVWPLFGSVSLNEAHQDDRYLEGALWVPVLPRG